MRFVQTLSLGFILVGVVILVFSGGVVADPSMTTTMSGDQTGSPVSIDQNTSDQILVFFESADSTTVKTSSTDLQSHASDTQAEFLAVADQTDALRVVTKFWITSAVLVEADRSAVDIERIAANSGAVAVHKNAEIEVDATAATPADVSKRSGDHQATPSTPNQPLTSHNNQLSSIEPTPPTTYGINMIDAPEVWSNYATTGEGTTVAVLDSGVEPDHPDIDLYTNNSTDPTYPGGWAEFDKEGNKVIGSTPYDSGDHGTHVSGTVAGGNASGTQIGVAPDVRLIHGKVAEGQSGTLAGVFAGMQWAMDNDADVVTLSLGSEPTPVWIDPVETLVDAGIVVVASSGNIGDGTSSSPGNLYSVVGTGAVDETRAVAFFSSGDEIQTNVTWGSHAPSTWPEEYVVPAVTAPGVGVNSTVPGGYSHKDGTSMAAPHVAGAIALMESASPEDTDFSPSETYSILRATSTDQPPEPGTRYGSGIANAFRAAMYVNDDGLLSGTITNETGNPIQNATVAVANVTTTTDEHGHYELLTDAGASEMSVSAFGYQTRTVPVDVKQGQSSTHNLVASSEFNIEVIDKWPETVTAGESASIVVRVANLESTSITFDSSSTAPIDRLELTVDNELIGFGDSQVYNRLRSEEFIIQVDTAESSVGTVRIDGIFEGLGESHLVTETVRIEPSRPAIAIADQESNGESVTVSASYHEASSRIGIYRDDQGEIGSRIGTSENLSGTVTHENVSVDLSESLSENTTVHAVVLEDDSPVTVSNELVSDTAVLTVNIDKPIQHPSGVSQDLFDAVDRNGTGDLSRADIRNMIRDYAQFGAVDSVLIDRMDVRLLIRWYALQ